MNRFEASALSLLPRLLLPLALLLAGSSAVRAQSPAAKPDGPVFSADDMKRGITMSATDCAAYRSTVYVRVQGNGLCFRYYLSTAGGSSAQAAYYLEGDSPADQFAFNPADLDRTAAKMSTDYGIPAVYLARMGLDGSSGWHRYRRTWLEVDATNLAISLINARHGFRTTHVMGQSGGGHLTGSLIGIRQDIGCALPGSGRLAFDEAYRAEQAKKSDPALRHYDPQTRLAEVVRRSGTTRILVVTDPGDKRVPAHMQTSFVRDVQRAGGRIAQFFVTATDKDMHGATPYIRRLMTECLKGTSDGDIAALVSRLSDQRWQRELARERATAGTPVAQAGLPSQARPNVYVPQGGLAQVTATSSVTATSVAATGPVGTAPQVPRTAQVSLPAQISLPVQVSLPAPAVPVLQGPNQARAPLAAQPKAAVDKPVQVAGAPR